MSFHMHLRATAAGDVPGDFASLFDFMWTAWEDHQAEHAAGIADSVEKSFGHLDQLYTGTTCQDEAAGASSTLPIYGGRLVPEPAGEHPPFVILDPPGVRAAAEFLQTAEFDVLWQTAATELSKAYVGWEDKNAAREIFLSHHDDLCTFYRRAALAGHAVIKAFWY